MAGRASWRGSPTPPASLWRPPKPEPICDPQATSKLDVKHHPASVAELAPHSPTPMPLRALPDENFLYVVKAARLRRPARAPGGQPAGHAALRPVPAGAARALTTAEDVAPRRGRPLRPAQRPERRSQARRRARKVRTVGGSPYARPSSAIPEDGRHGVHGRLVPPPIVQVAILGRHGGRPPLQDRRASNRPSWCCDPRPSGRPPRGNPRNQLLRGQAL